MIGNDIVDLRFAKLNSRWQEQRFLDKIFTVEEQHYIFSQPNQFQNIWRMWSMKESVYKLNFRTEKVIRFNPKDFQCTIESENIGAVKFYAQFISTHTKTNSDFIYSTAFTSLNWQSETFFLSEILKEQRVITYQKIIEFYADLKGHDQKYLTIKKNPFGIPEIYYNNILEKEQLSLSHHGKYGACAFTVN